MNVMIKSPVTSTAAKEARNSTVVSRGFSGCVFSVLATRFCPVNGRCPPLVDYSKCPVPSRHLEQMTECIGEVIEFITRRRRNRQVVFHTPHRPINQQRPPDNVFSRNEAPVAAVVAVVSIIPEHEIIPFGNDQFAVFYQFLHLQPPFAFQTGS